MSNLVDHARRELTRAGMYDSGDVFDNYNNMVADAVMGLTELFAEQGHSGFSAGLTIHLFSELASFKAITPLSDNPEEWVEVGPSVWQNVRDSECFSEDGGKSYRKLSERPSGWWARITRAKAPLHTSQSKES